MAFPFYLAMTAAEFSGAAVLPALPAWMACHFSPYATGLSNCPDSLPPGAMLIVNDRTPIHGHDPACILDQLKGLVETLGCARVLLDFQRPGELQTTALVHFLEGRLPCPVGVSALYGRETEGPVFLPPVPVQTSARDYLAPWAGREIWLDMALDGAQITVTPEGCSFAPFSPQPDWLGRHMDETLCCHYEIRLAENRATFFLCRTADDLRALLRSVQALGVTAGVGLYQELGNFNA